MKVYLFCLDICETAPLVKIIEKAWFKVLNFINWGIYIAYFYWPSSWSQKTYPQHLNTIHSSTLKYLCFGFAFVYNRISTTIKFKKQAWNNVYSLQKTIPISFLPQTNLTCLKLRVSLNFLLSGSPNLFYLNTQLIQ
jgi:hypothetical protein